MQPEELAKLRACVRPRHYAMVIANMATREQRAKALESVPAEWRELVQKHVEISWQKRRK